MPETLQLRVHSGPSDATLIYLPGLHGDWTLIGPLRRALSAKVRFAEVTYPRTLNWSLDDYAQAVEDALFGKEISSGWILAESFSSQVLWPILQRGRFHIDGIILAGGFVRHPSPIGVRLAATIAGHVPPLRMIHLLLGYSRLARWRVRKDAETTAELREFCARRTELDMQAMCHRLGLIARSDFRPIVAQSRIPVYAVTGMFDAIVPWFWVRRWLRKNCASLGGYRVVWNCDHNVLPNASDMAAAHILQWMKV